MTDLPMTKADDDLVEKLRDNRDGVNFRLRLLAADEITRLRAQLAAAEADNTTLRNLHNRTAAERAYLQRARDTAESQLQAMRKALEETRAIVVDAALVGFNYKSGDWAERLFANQGNITQALRSLTEG